MFLRKIFFHSLFFIIYSSLFSSCETDLEVNAPYKEITVVYGLLNQQDSAHFIKINKTFLGKENAYVMATQRDSSEYNRPGTPRMNATVEEWKSGAIQRTWILKDTTITNKEAGNFYNPDQTIYYFKDNLDASAQYKLQVNVNDGEKVVTAKTNIIDNFIANGNIGTPCSNGSGQTCLALYSNGQYNDNLEFKWVSVKNGKRYQLSMIFNYTEYSTDGSSSAKSIEWVFQPPQQSNNANGGEALSVPIKGEDFYKELKKQLEPLTNATVKKREFESLIFSLYVAADDLNTYLLANSPSTGIVQEKQEWTNIEPKENGIGIFSSRISAKSDPKGITDESRKELAIGTHTQSLRFCENINGGNFGTCQ